MAGTNWARWAPLSGVAFVVLWIVAFLVMGDGPDSDSNEDILSYYADSGNRDKQAIGFFMILAASLFLLWFLTVLRGHLARAEGRPGPYTAIGFGAGLVATALWTVANMLFVVISFAADEDEFTLDPDTWRVVSSAGYVTWFSATTVAAVLVFSTALLSMRAPLLPKWLAWLSVLVALTMLVAFFFIPFLIFLGWMLVVSILLMWRPAAPPDVQPAGLD